jgi:CheY-like chemotaxis protein
LGLPLVEIMMRRHGGVFELESEENKGTTARVVFPPERLIWRDANQPDGSAETDRIDARETDFGEPVSPIPMRLLTSFGTTRVLVVEDDQDLCDVVQRMLKRSGFATAGASSGREALGVLRTEPIDLVITDMVMPEMDGVELMRVLQKERPDLPIITLSGMDDVMEYRRIAAHLGARVALLKPVSRADLVRAVTNALAGQVSNSGKLARA